MRYRLNVFLTPLPKVGCPKVLEIQNPWGKVVERWVSDLNIFAQKRSKIAAAKKVFMDKKEVFPFEVPVKRLFAPTFQNRMSKFFRDLGSSGEK